MTKNYGSLGLFGMWVYCSNNTAKMKEGEVYLACELGGGVSILRYERDEYFLVEDMEWEDFESLIFNGLISICD